MFPRALALFLFALLALPLLAAATATTTVTVTAPTATSIPVSQCNTGSIQCCNSLSPSSDSLVSIILGLLGIVISGVTTLVGITCSPINIIGLTGASCAAQPVCCENDNFSGIIAIGCVPINISL